MQANKQQGKGSHVGAELSRKRCCTLNDQRFLEFAGDKLMIKGEFDGIY